MTPTTLRGRPPGAPETTSPPHHRARVGSIRWQLAACVVLAAASLALPGGLGYDPWAWLVWGRELVDGTLSTAGGPSWKPLPVLVTAPLSLFGDAAPALWTLVARAGGLFMLVLAYRLAARFAGPVAGVVAVAALVLGPDAEARLVRHLSQANVEPLTAALCLWAVERHLDGRHAHAVVLLGIAGLSRPEIWPFLLVYAAWLVMRDASRSWLVVPLLVAVPALWFGGDWLGAGDPLVGAERAQVLGADAVQRMRDVVGRVGAAVVVPAWIAAAVGVVTAIRRREPVILVLALAAAAWLIEVVAMTTLLGFAGLSRFLQPAVALVCVLAGIGAVRLVRALGARAAELARALEARAVGSAGGLAARSVGRTAAVAGRVGRTAAVARSAAVAGRVARNATAVRIGLAVVLLAASLPFVAPRAGWVRVQVADAAERARLDADLGRVLDRVGGRDELLACGPVVVDHAVTGLESQPSIAWKRDLPLADVRHRIPKSSPGTAVVLVGRAQDDELTSRDDAYARELARTSRWAAFAVRCAGP